MKVGGFAVAGCVLAATMTLSGCRVDSHKNGANDNVKIATPFGGLSVKTDDDAMPAGVGLSVYPGATMVKKLHHDHDGEGHDSGSADINMSFGNFHLGSRRSATRRRMHRRRCLRFIARTWRDTGR